MRRFETKVAALRDALNDPVIRTDAAEVIRPLIGKAVVHVAESEDVTLEEEASTATLVDVATNQKPRLAGGVFRSMAWLRGQDLNL